MKTRRDFLSLLGKATLSSVMIGPVLESFGNYNNRIAPSPLSEEEKKHLRNVVMEGLKPTDKDDLVLTRALKSNMLIKWNTPINETEMFGYNNDFTCFIPVDADHPNDGFLWVNHEYTHPLFVSGYDYTDKNQQRTKEQVEKEMKSVGGAIVRVKKINGKWEFIPNDTYNRRLDANTSIPFNWDEKIKGSDHAIGTHSNCSGGITPWGTILSCEENYDQFAGETKYDDHGNPYHEDSDYGWDKFYAYPPEHYGWVVEIDPFTGKAQKHIALGRFAHECCTLKKLDDGRIVAYTGDDANDEFIYKFISSKPGSLKEGTLYVADTENGTWIPLDYEKQPLLREKFKNQTEVLIRCREAARMLGATPQNRPEDIEIDPLTGHIIIALTNNKPKGDYHGSLLKITEENGRHDALTFTPETLLTGGEETGFSCPDNLVFDLSGNLWFTSDISGGSMNREDKPYTAFKNNGLFVLIRHGEASGKIIQLASAPKDAEFTGPWFTPDYKTLFLAVQHPGEQTKSLSNPTSTWPHDSDGIPKPAVVTIEGDLLDKLNYLNVLG